MTTVRRFNWMLLALLTVSECSSRTVSGRTGEDVTLPCKYDIKYNGARSVCWSKGHLTVSGCINQIISTDGHKVIETTRASSRYQLLGRLEDGDVSLTILNTTEEDAGRYGCRVDIAGWFNDKKHHIDLTIERISDPQSTTEVTTEQTDIYTTGQMNFTESLPTSSSNSTKLEKFEEDVAPQTSSSVTVVLVCVLFVLVALLTAVAVAIIARKWNRLKMPQQQVQISSSTLQFHSRASAVENIYQIDGSEYELCP